MNEIESTNKAVLAQTEELFPILINTQSVNLAKYEKIPFDKIASLGVGLEPVTVAIQQAINGAGGSGLYMVTVKNGGTLMRFKNESGYLGTIKAANGGVGGGQAVLNPVLFDPTMVFMAATMFMMQKKLDAIQETQKEILGFLEKKEKAELRGNIIVLNDIINNYKYNWNNDQFLNNNHMKVLDIKQKSEQSILFAHDRIKETLSKRQLIQLSSDVSSRVKKVNKAFEDYQLAMYSYAMASYVESLLLKNFNKDYMDSVADKIESYSISYRELYTDCYNRLLDLVDKSTDNIVVDRIGKISRAAGEVIAKIPLVSDGQLDENLITIGEIINDSDNAVRNEKLSGLVSKQSSYVSPFVDNVRMIGRLHEKPLDLMFDKDGIYIEKSAVMS